MMGYVRCKYWRKMRYGCKGTVCTILATLFVNLKLFQIKIIFLKNRKKWY